MAELAGTGRHLSATELRLWTSFLDAGRMLEEVLANHLMAEHDMTHREYEVLVRLDGFGGHLRMSDLAKQMVASPPLITQTVVRLENRGWVGRRSALSDGRGVEAFLEDAGRAALLAASAPHAALVRRLLVDRVGPDDLEGSAQSLTRVAEHLRAHRSGSACSDPACALNI